MNPIKISDRALTEIKNIFDTKGIPSDYCLRITVKGSGCAGINHAIGFDKLGDNDEQYDYDGLKVIINKKDFMHLIGVSVDFTESNDVTGFVFS